MQNLSKNHKEIKNNLINLDVKMFLDVKCLKEHSGEVCLILKFIVWLLPPYPHSNCRDLSGTIRRREEGSDKLVGKILKHAF